MRNANAQNSKLAAGAATMAAAAAASRDDRQVHTVDRRQAKRVEARKLTAIYVSRSGAGGEEPTSEPVPACILNFSTTGLGMIVARPLTPGQRFQVDIREGGGVTALLYAVVRSDPWQDCHRIGAVLLEVAAAPHGKRTGNTRVQRAVARLRRAVAS
jgi:hypothetical protein